MRLRRRRAPPRVRAGFPRNRRCPAERTLAWLSRNRRLAKDFEASIATAQTWLFLGNVQILLRRLVQRKKQ